MTSEFSHDPVKLRIINLKKGTWKQTYVFVGEVPKDVLNELHKLEKNPGMPNSSILKKFYGAGWREKLGVQEFSKSKKGGYLGYLGGNLGDEPGFEIDDDLLADLGDISLDTGAQESSETTKDSNEPQQESSETTQEASEPTQEIEEELITLEDLTPQVDFLTEKESTLEVTHAGGVKFITDLVVSPADNILEFKLKIYAAIGIPIYRQHMWFKYRERSYPMQYVISTHKHVESVDIERLITFYKDPKAAQGIDDVNGIPVEIEFYNSKDFLHVSARDTFEVLRNIYYKYATNEYFVVDLNDLISTADLYSKVQKDKYQLELIYYGFIVLYFPMITFSVFQDYLKNERMIKEMYPDLLPEKHSIKNNLFLEGSITQEAYELLDDNKIQKKIFSSITGTSISISNFNQDVDVVLSLRNLFDVLELTEMITYCKANLIHENQNVILRKSYMNEKEPKDILSVNSILIKIRINQDTNENIRLILFKNGNYIVKTEWREENHMDFKKITKLVAEKINPIIKMINKYGERVKFHKVPLIELSSDNAIFTETAMSFYYDDDMTEARFNVLKSVLEDFRKVGIISAKENSLIGLEFFFNKGMYKYDPSRIEKAIAVDNYYEFLSNGMVKQKWDSVFIRTRLFQVINVSSKLKITISGIRDDIELEFFHMYLTALLSIYTRSAAHIKVMASETMQTKTKKALKNLKIQDPILYNFKKIYNSPVIYSKICQKPYQPVILTDEEYGKLPKDRKSKALKYWNFTKQKPVWYSCPNPKYPYVKFIVKQHPRDFCIPCCKKIQMNENVNKKKQEIHNTCLTKHEYTGEKVNLTKGSHYIASYGKNIEPGRISRLPENTLEPLFFDTYSPEGGIDQECVTADGYYLFGIAQHIFMINDIGMLHAVSHSLSLTVKDFLSEAVLRIKTTPDKFRVILDGNAGLYFKDYNDLCDSLLEIDNENGIENPAWEHIPWNFLISSIAYYYFGVNIILFDDQQKEVIELILPKGLKTHVEMFPDTHKNLVILRKKTKYYPIYMFNTEIFKRTGIIDTKLFLNESGLIVIIRAIVRRHFETQEFEKIKSHIDLVTIKDFCKDQGIHIFNCYINYSNLCYAVVLEYKKTKIYFPIASSHYPLEKGVKLLFTPYQGEYNATIQDLQKILKLFHQWNLERSALANLEGILLYPDVEVQQWLTIRDSDKVIGFLHNNINYFIKEISIKAALEVYKKPIQTLLYHPYEINALIHSVKQGTKTISHLAVHEDKLNQSLYDFYLYNIVLMHFISVFNEQRNIPLRTKLSGILAKTDFNKDLSKLREFIDQLTDPEDVHKLKNIISRYVSTHHDKKQLILDIKNTYFNFDKIALEKLRNKSVKDIRSELHKLSSKFVKIGKVKINKFQNMFIACDANERLSYCDKSKLVIEKSKLDDIIDILASEVANPAKWKWLFNNAFIDRTVSFFRFIRRKNETITIEFL